MTVRSLIALLSVVLFVSACAGMLRRAAIDQERVLAAAGFRMKLANTPERRMQSLRRLISMTDNSARLGRREQNIRRLSFFLFLFDCWPTGGIFSPHLPILSATAGFCAQPRLSFRIDPSKCRPPLLKLLKRPGLI